MDPRQSIPSVEKLLSHSLLQGWEDRLSHSIRVQLVQRALESVRGSQTIPAPDGIATVVKKSFEDFFAPGLRRCINATGVVLHTNLGRAPLGHEALNALADSVWGYCSLELDLVTGERGERGRKIEKLVTALTGAPSGLVVNNNAAAVFLVLSAIAKGKEVIISRGEMVQIGGGFRVPEILAEAGAKLVEVGTTNITTLNDYAAKIGEQTGCLLKVHQSNFVQQGHVESVEPKALAKLAGEKKVPMVLDLGSGAIGRSEGELTVADAVRAGASLVCFSGDKLLGGTQAGFVVGDTAWVKTVKSYPLYRALRLGKTEIFLLEWLLRRNASGRPSLATELIGLSAETIQKRATNFLSLIPFLSGARAIEGQSSVGGGARPEEPLPTTLIEIPVDDEMKWSRALLSREVPIIPRKEKGRLLIDLRTVLSTEENEVVDALKEVSVCSF